VQTVKGLQSRQDTFLPGAAAGLTPTLQRRRTRASLRACNWDPLPNAPLVLLDGPYAAPAMRWEVRQLLPGLSSFCVEHRMGEQTLNQVHGRKLVVHDKSYVLRSLPAGAIIKVVVFPGELPHSCLACCAPLLITCRTARW
jgi:hypothetical protein